MHEDVIWFYVTVHNVVLGQYLERLDDLSEVYQSPLLGKRALLLHKLVQSATITILVHEVEVVGSF